MKKHLILISAAAVACQAFAQQISVELKLACGEFITGEPVLIQVKVRNQMRDALEFGENADDKFLIEVCKDAHDNELTPESGKPFMTPLVLSSGSTLDHKMEVDKWFSVYDSGKYLIRAVVVHDDMRYESARKSFDVIPGMRLKEGVQMFADKKQYQRKFMMVHWTRNQARHLFLRIEDEPDGVVWDTIDLGVFSRTIEPKLDIAPNGEVTVFHRADSDNYLRTVIWSLPGSVEIAERDALMDPDVSAAQQMRALYGDLPEKLEGPTKRSWWKLW